MLSGFISFSRYGTGSAAGSRSLLYILPFFGILGPMLIVYRLPLTSARTGSMPQSLPSGATSTFCLQWGPQERRSHFCLSLDRVATSHRWKNLIDSVWCFWRAPCFSPHVFFIIRALGAVAGLRWVEVDTTRLALRYKAHEGNDFVFQGACYCSNVYLPPENQLQRLSNKTVCWL